MSDPLSVQDHVSIVVTEDGGLRARAALTTGLVQEALRRHQPSPWAGEALARALSAMAVFPAEWSKYDRISLQLTSRGPLRTVFAELRSPGFLRGYVGDGSAVLPDEPLAERGRSLGIDPPGVVVVMRQRADGKHDLGQAALTSGQVDEDIEAFFSISDQVPCRLWAGVRRDEDGQVIAAGSVLLQPLPSGRPLPPRLDGAALLQALTEVPDAEALLAVALPEPVRVLDEIPLVFRCPCTRERMEAGIALLGDADLDEMIEVDHGAEVTCHFCAGRYTFSAADLAALKAQRGEAGSA